MNIREKIAEQYGPEVLLVDGHDNAIIGVAPGEEDGYVAVYDREAIIENLCEGGMLLEDAQEFYEFNILGSNFGPHTPIYIDTIEGDEYTWNG